MKNGSRLTAALALPMALFLGSCAQTKIKGIWMDPTFREGRLRKLMVLAVAEDPNDRRIFENQFVAVFGRRGVEVIPSHRHLPGEKKLEKDTVRAAVEEAGLDAVVVTRMVGMDIKFIQRAANVYAAPYSDRTPQGTIRRPRGGGPAPSLSSRKPSGRRPSYARPGS